VLGLHHAVGRVGVELQQRVHRLVDLRLDHAAELHHARRDAVEFAVELAGEVFFGHVSP
jgi:hypothetical protein